MGLKAQHDSEGLGRFVWLRCQTARDSDALMNTISRSGRQSMRKSCGGRASDQSRAVIARRSQSLEFTGLGDPDRFQQLDRPTRQKVADLLRSAAYRDLWKDRVKNGPCA